MDPRMLAMFALTIQAFWRLTKVKQGMVVVEGAGHHMQTGYSTIFNLTRLPKL